MKNKWLIVLFLVTNMVSARDYPFSGSVYGVKAEHGADVNLSYDCSLDHEAHILNCNFTRVAIRKKIDKSEVAEFRKKMMDMFELDELDEQTCKKNAEFLDMIDGKIEHNNEAMKKELLNPDLKKKYESIRVSIKLLKDLCDSPESKKSYKAYIDHIINEQLNTCKITSQNFKQSFESVSNDKVWTNNRGLASGRCGIIDTSRFIATDRGAFSWDYISSKTVTNKTDKETDGLLKCSDLDENEYHFSDAGDTTLYIGCEIIEWAIF